MPFPSTIEEIDTTSPSRYDLATFFGRVRHFQEVTDFRSCFITTTSIDNAKAIVEKVKYRQGPGTIPSFLTPPPPTQSSFSTIDVPSNVEEVIKKNWKDFTPEEYYNARKILSATLHPDTSQPVPRLFRFCAFLPANIPILIGMLHPSQQTPMRAMFWQWINQTFNVGVNYCNRTIDMPKGTPFIQQPQPQQPEKPKNDGIHGKGGSEGRCPFHIFSRKQDVKVEEKKIEPPVIISKNITNDNDISASDSKCPVSFKNIEKATGISPKLLTSYSIAVLASCGVSYMGNSILHRMGSSAPYLFRIGIPYFAVAIASTANVVAMRSSDIFEGIRVKDVETGEELPTPSRNAGLMAVSQVAISRILLPMPLLLLPPIFMDRLFDSGKYKFFTRRRAKLYLPVQIAFIIVAIVVVLPFAIAVFPQDTVMDIGQLEEEIFGSAVNSKGNKVKQVTFNKGL
eukprot:Tbor_TRINITY_DN5303_c2_g1::TRINITY_DN5303_c2_g1_i1::g.4004::m.4004